MSTKEINEAIVKIASTRNKKDALDAHKLVRKSLPNCKITKGKNGSWLIENYITGAYILTKDYGYISGSDNTERNDDASEFPIRTDKAIDVDIAQKFIDWNKEWHKHPEHLYSHDISNNCTILKWGESGYYKTDFPAGEYDDETIDELNAKRWFDGNIIKAKRVRYAMECCSIVAQNNPNLDWEQHYEMIMSKVAN